MKFEESLFFVRLVREHEAAENRLCSIIFFLVVLLVAFVVLFLADAVIIGKQHILALRTCEEINLVCRHGAVSGKSNEPGLGKGFEFCDGKVRDGVSVSVADGPAKSPRLIFDESAVAGEHRQCVYCIYRDALSVGVCEALKAYFDIHFPLLALPPPKSGVGFRQALCPEHCYAYSQSVAAYGLAKILREESFRKQACKPPCDQKQGAGEAVSSGEIEKTR